MAIFSRGDYVFTDHYLLFKIKMDACFCLLQFIFSSPVQSIDQSVASKILAPRAALVGWYLQSYWCARLLDIWLIITIVTFFFLFWLFLIKKIYIILMPHLIVPHATSNHAPISKQYQEFFQILSSYKSYHSKILRRSIWI